MYINLLQPGNHITPEMPTTILSFDKKFLANYKLLEESVALIRYINATDFSSQLNTGGD